MGQQWPFCFTWPSAQADGTGGKLWQTTSTDQLFYGEQFKKFSTNLIMGTIGSVLESINHFVLIKCLIKLILHRQSKDACMVQKITFQLEGSRTPVRVNSLLFFS